MAKKKSKAYSRKELEIVACLASLKLGDYTYDDNDFRQFTVTCDGAYEHTFVRNRHGYWECDDIELDEMFDDLDDDDLDDFDKDDFDDFNDFDKEDFDDAIDDLDDDYDDAGDNLKSSLISALEQVYKTNHTIIPPCKL